MSWLLPAAWLAGGVALAAIAIAHLLSRRRPPPELLPTVRFVPERAARITSRGISPSDLLLLLVRALAIVALAAAFAGPVIARSTGVVARVIAVDRSRSVASMRSVRDSAQALHRPGDVLLAFDTSAMVLASPADIDTASTRAQGSISVALAGAIRSGATLTARADSVELVIVSPFAAGELDAASTDLRTSWPGRIRVVRVPGAASARVARSIDAPGTTDDPVVAASQLAGPRAAGADVRLLRTTPSSADSAWARTTGHVLIHWPADGLTPPGWRARAQPDTIGGVIAGSAVVVATFARVWHVDGEPIARWSDGEPAVAQHTVGEGCLRDVAIPVSRTSDLALRPEFLALLETLARPCVPDDGATVPDSVLTLLAGSNALAPSSALRTSGATRSPWTPWLLAAALALLGGEWLLRRNRSAA